MTPDERSELLCDAELLAYQTIRFTGLYKELSSDEWDQLAERLGRVTLRYVEALIDEEFTRLESAKESANAVKRHWKIYRGTIWHWDMGNTIYWSTSEAGIKKLLREAYNKQPEAYETRGDYSYVYIEPTKRGLTEWLQRNINYDNG